VLCALYLAVALWLAIYEHLVSLLIINIYVIIGANKNAACDMLGGEWTYAQCSISILYMKTEKM
jgi:hypothetical protein